MCFPHSRTMTLLAAAAIVCSLSSAHGATYTVKKLPSLKKNEAKNPSKDYGIERYKVSDTQVKDIYEIRVTYAAKCGMEKKPGLTINFIHNNVGEYESSSCRHRKTPEWSSTWRSCNAIVFRKSWG